MVSPPRRPFLGLMESEQIGQGPLVLVELVELGGLVGFSSLSAEELR